MHRNFRSITRRLMSFTAQTDGAVAVIFGLCAVPILMAISIGLDMASASMMKSEMQAAADSAVLAAAGRLAVNADEADKEQIALDTFYTNLSPVLSEHAGTPDINIDFPNKQVRLVVDVEVENLLSSFASDGVGLKVTAAAGISPGTAICMIAFNPHASKALNIQGTADVMANACAVHVNSDDNDDALYQNGSGSATAESFCVRGRHSGSAFTPSPKEPCFAENDPLEDLFASDWAAAGIDSLPCTSSNLPQINLSTASTVTNLDPGVYCGGLTIKKGIVQLQQGQMYVFRNGSLNIQANGTLQGSQTPILLHGDNTTRLVTQAGASIVVSARSSGLFKGIAVAQHPSSIPSPNENLIIGGGEMEIEGILYLPKQPLKITGNGDIGASVSQFAIMADTISIEGNGELNIRIGQNYQSSGLPALPEANEIISLIE